MVSSRKRTKKVKELLPLEESSWVVTLIQDSRDAIGDVAMTVGFSRYDRAELRMRIDPFTPNAVMAVLTEIAKIHFDTSIVEGVFTDAKLRHPTGERWRFLVRKCSVPSLHATLAAYGMLCTSYGGTGMTTSEYYRHGMYDIVFSDADNLLPGEAGYDKKIDKPNEVATIH